MFDKILIADRGDTAVRVARTCKRMGVDTVTLHSELDKGEIHCQVSDESVQVAHDQSGTYLSPVAVLEAAKRTGANAIHPGYGSLARDPAFARAVVEAGLVFIGPTSELLEVGRDRLAARQAAKMAGIRVPLGSEGLLADHAAAERELDALEGGPCRLKPVDSARLALTPINDLESLETAWRASQQAGGVYMELEIDQPRRLDIQIVGDAEGSVVALWERECSIRRWRGPLIVESPAPSLSGSERGDRVREAMCDSAVRIAKEAGITSTVSVRFLLDSEDRFYFAGLTPALDPDHDSTEMCTGLDLVELQLRIASGESMPDEVHRAAPSGHGMTARLCAENPLGEFLAEPAEVREVRWPAATPGKLRVEAAVQAGTLLREEHGTTLAKITTWAPTRHQSLLALDRSLAESVVAPVGTNVDQLREVLNHESFRASQYDVTFVKRLIG